MDVAVGVDPHKASFATAAVDPQVRKLGSKQFANTRKGYLELVNWAGQFGEKVRFGIEGSGSYGGAGSFSPRSWF